MGFNCPGLSLTDNNLHPQKCLAHKTKNVSHENKKAIAKKFKENK